MTWREHAWEFTVSTLSWAVAIVAIVFVVALFVYDATRNRRKVRR